MRRSHDLAGGDGHVDLGATAERAHLSVIASSANRGWVGVYAEEVWHRAADFGLPAISDHLLVFHLGRPLHIEEQVRGNEGLLGEGSMTVLPAEAATRWQLGREGDVRHLHLFLRPQLIHDVAAEAGVHADRVEIVPAIGSRNQRFEQLGLALLGELHSDGLGSRIYAESLATLLAVELLRHQSAAGLPPSRRTGRLSAAALDRVKAYVDAHLGDDLSLRSLADAIGLSAFHFARQFRAATGLSPHQYVIRCRVERASLLLASSDRPLAAIAQDVGFASSSHLATHVRRLLGVSPSSLR